MRHVGLGARADAYLETLTSDAFETSKIEGENLDYVAVRSSVAERLGMRGAVQVHPDDRARGVAEMTLDATQNFCEPLTADRLFNWHRLLLPGEQHLKVGDWRAGPVSVINEQRAGLPPIIHFVGPPAERVPTEMSRFLEWFNAPYNGEGLLRSALAHLWFLTIHPFEDGNGRIARAIADMALAQDEKTERRYFSMTKMIHERRKAYYEVLERTQRGTLDVTDWLVWYFLCLGEAIQNAQRVLADTLKAGAFWAAHSDVAFSERQRKVMTCVLHGYDGRITTKNWSRLGNTSRETAGRDLQDLVEKGVLFPEGAGRSAHYVLREFV